MRKRFKLLLPALFGMALTACNQEKFNLGMPFTLEEGDAMVAREDKMLEVYFARVVEDSRCPVNVNCIWEGEAVVKFAVSHAGMPEDTLTLTLRGGYRDLASSSIGPYNVSLLRLDPYPVADTKIKKGGYTAQLLVELVRKP